MNRPLDNRPFDTATSTMTPRRCLALASAAMVLFIGALILAPFPHYLPPDFGFGFLRNKQSFFYSTPYFIGFYAHIGASPIVLICGTLQMSRSLRLRWPRSHRLLGKIYVLLVLCLMAPGGLVMSTRAFGGWSTAICFALISSLAWLFTLIAWRAAKGMRYADHRRWMCRSYLMICSAIMLRLVLYLMQPLGLDRVFAYQLAAWLSWLPALAIFELANWLWNQPTRPIPLRTRSDE